MATVALKDILNADSSIVDEQGRTVVPSATNAILSWRPAQTGREVARIVSKLAANRAKINRLVGESSEYFEARKAIIESHQTTDEAGNKAWAGKDDAERKATLRAVNDAIAEYAKRDVEVSFDMISFERIVELGCSLSAETADQLRFMLDFTPLPDAVEPAPSAA